MTTDYSALSTADLYAAAAEEGSEIEGTILGNLCYNSGAYKATALGAVNTARRLTDTVLELPYG